MARSIPANPGVGEVSARFIHDLAETAPALWTPHRPARPEKSEGGRRFEVVSAYEPAGDQPAAIAQICEGLDDGLTFQTLLGVTGSGKTFTMEIGRASV